MAIKRPKLKFLRGNTYVIDQSDSSNAGHPLRFTADSGATEYTHGVTITGTPGQAGATVTFNVPDSAPTNIMYYCSTHGIGMGNKMKTVSDPSNPVTYTGGEGVYGSSITHGQWRNPTDSTTNNPQIYIRQQVVGGLSQSTAAVNLRNALNNLEIGDTITVSTFNPDKVFTISGGISTYLDTNTDYRVWLFDVDAQGLTNSTYFYEFTIPTTSSAPSNLITRPNMATKPFTAADSDDHWAVPYLSTDLTAYKALIDSASPHYRPPYVAQSSSNYSIDNIGNLNDSGNYVLYGREDGKTPISGNWASNVNGERVWMEFAQSGRKLFVADRYHIGYNVYDLSTPYEIETAVEDSSKAIATGTDFYAPFISAGYSSALINNADGNFKFNDEGDEVTILYPGGGSAALRTFGLSTPFDMSTVINGSLVETGFNSGWSSTNIGTTLAEVMDSNRIYGGRNDIGNFALQDAQFDWVDSGKKLAITGGSYNGTFLVYDVPTPYDHSSITWHGTGHNLYSAMNLFDIRDAIQGRTGYAGNFSNNDFSFSDDGKTLYQTNNYNSIWEYKLDSAYNLGSIDSSDVNILYQSYDTLAGGDRINLQWKSVRIAPNGRLNVGFNAYYDSSGSQISTVGINYFDLTTNRGLPPGYGESDNSFFRSTATSLIATVATGNLYTDTGLTGSSGNVYYMSIDEGVIDSNESDGSFFVDSNSTVSITLDDLYGGGYGNAFALTGIAGFTWGGARGFILGGIKQNPTAKINNIEYWTIATPGNAIDFGDLTTARQSMASMSSGTRGVVAGGYESSVSVALNEMQYITCATPGNAIDFGDLTWQNFYGAGHSNGTKGFYSGGQRAAEGSYGYVNTIDQITIATAGNATDTADLTVARAGGDQGVNDATRAVHMGGQSALGREDTIDYFSMDTTSNAIDFGDMASGGRVRAASGSDVTYGILAGGRRTGSSNANDWTENIDYITIQTTGNSSDFGDLTTFYENMSGASDNTYMTMAGAAGNDGSSNVRYNVIERITIATPGNSADFGDLTQEVEQGAGMSGNAA